MDFLKNVTKDLEKAGLHPGSAEPPKYWHSTGNYVLNRIISGDYNFGIPQGRVTGIAGASGSGKSFNAVNIMREAQKDGAFVVTLDSENALDDDFVTKLGVNTDPEHYMYIPITTIPECKQAVSKFTEGYKKEYGVKNDDAPKVLIVIDSLDMLMTETEVSHYENGKTAGDQGQRNKQLKAMLREFVQAIKFHNISMVVTSQVYKNQDIRNGEGIWIVSDAVKYSLSQIILLSKLKLKEDTEVTGIRMKCEGYKTRFTQPFQSVTIEVPYETGMDPYNGLLDVAVSAGIVKKAGGWYSLVGNDKKWRASDFSKTYAKKVLTQLCQNDVDFLEAEVDNKDIDTTNVTSSKKRKDKFESANE